MIKQDLGITLSNGDQIRFSTNSIAIIKKLTKGIRTTTVELEDGDLETIVEQLNGLVDVPLPSPCQGGIPDLPTPRVAMPPTSKLADAFRVESNASHPKDPPSKSEWGPMGPPPLGTDRTGEEEPSED